MEKFRLTKLEKAWILYDIGNSAFILIVSTIIPIYFEYLTSLDNISNSDYVAYWGYASSVATLIVAVIGPVFGAISDNKNFKKPIFAVSLFVGAISCAMLGLASHWLVFITIFIVAKVGYSSSVVFYDSMLPDITSEERMDVVSSQGYAWGYIGSCIPFALGLVLVLQGESLFGFSLSTSMTIAFLIVAVWWVLTTIPLLKNYKQIHYVETKKGAVKESFTRLFNTLTKLKENKKVFIFMIAFFFYIDGVYTIIEMATAYGTALGLSSDNLLLALLATQLVGFPSAIVFGRLSKKHSVTNLITICIVAYIGIALFALFITHQTHFWILAIVVGLFQGGIQALSRSYFAKIIPPEKSGEFFGLFDICGKGASFFGTLLMAMATQLTNNPNVGVAMLSVLFVIGLLLFRKQAKM